MKNQIGLIGLAVMGENLARNIANNGYKISVYNRTAQKTKDFIDKKHSPNLFGTYDIKEFVDSLETPRKIIVMVQAGNPVDDVIDALLPHLDKNDIIIDAGNSFYKDSQVRFEKLSKQDIHFIGCGVSGGEKGALEGPSIMPGGTLEAYNQVKEILEKISAKDFSGGNCVSYIGAGASGHYVKMVHNGIEYGVMQIIAEAYDILRKIYRLSPDEIAKIFEKVSKQKLSSYLFDISLEVLNKKDDLTEDSYLIDNILDVAGAKGTGLWTSLEGLERGQPLGTIIEATQARTLSSQKDLRNALSREYILSQMTAQLSVNNFTKKLENALYAGILITYAQGLSLISMTSKEENWNINLAEVTRIWQGGCIIRAEVLNFLTEAYSNNPDVENILELSEIRQELLLDYNDLKDVLKVALDGNIPTPTLQSALQYFFGIISNKSSANMIQGLRDYFGAHTYERKDREGIFHTNWS